MKFPEILGTWILCWIYFAENFRTLHWLDIDDDEDDEHHKAYKDDEGDKDEDDKDNADGNEDDKEFEDNKGWGW